MLRIHTDCLQIVREIAPLADQIAKRDPDQARQLRRSALSIHLNVAEGAGSRGGRRRMRYEDALGSARETRANLEAAEAVGYVQLDSDLLDRLAKVTGTLVRVLY